MSYSVIGGMMDANNIVLELDREIARLALARDLLLYGSGNTRNGATVRIGKKKRVLSPEAQKRIADAQRRRWATREKPQNEC